MEEERWKDVTARSGPDVQRAHYERMRLVSYLLYHNTLQLSLFATPVGDDDSRAWKASRRALSLASPLFDFLKSGPVTVPALKSVYLCALKDSDQAIVTVSPGGKGASVTSDMDVSITLVSPGDARAFFDAVTRRTMEMLQHTALKARFDCNIYFIVGNQGVFWDPSIAERDGADELFLAGICQKCVFRNSYKTPDRVVETCKRIRTLLGLDPKDLPNMNVICEYYREDDADGPWKQTSVRAERAMFEAYVEATGSLVDAGKHASAGDVVNLLQYQPESYVFPGCTALMVPLYEPFVARWLATPRKKWLVVMENVVDALSIPIAPKAKYVKRSLDLLCKIDNLMDDRMCHEKLGQLLQKYKDAGLPADADVIHGIQLDASSEGRCDDDACMHVYGARRPASKKARRPASKKAREAPSDDWRPHLIELFGIAWGHVITSVPFNNEVRELLFALAAPAV